jgi:hypothetical protein
MDIQLAGVGVVFLDVEDEGDAQRCSLCFKALDDGRSYAVALEAGKQLDAGQFNAAGGGDDPQSAGGLVIDLDHTGCAFSDLAEELLAGPLGEIGAPLLFIKAVRKAALSLGSREDHIGKEPDVLGSCRPYPVARHRAMLSLPTTIVALINMQRGASVHRGGA